MGRPTLPPAIAEWKSSSSRRRSFSSSRFGMRVSLRRKSDIAEDPVDGAGQALEFRLGIGQARLAGGAETVKAGAAIAVRHAPLGRDQPLHLQALEGGVERPLFDGQYVGRRQPDLLGDAVAVKLRPAERLEDEKVERSRQERRVRAGPRHT